MSRFPNSFFLLSFPFPSGSTLHANRGLYLPAPAIRERLPLCAALLSFQPPPSPTATSAPTHARLFSAPPSSMAPCPQIAMLPYWNCLDLDKEGAMSKIRGKSAGAFVIRPSDKSYAALSLVKPDGSMYVIATSSLRHHYVIGMCCPPPTHIRPIGLSRPWNAHPLVCYCPYLLSSYSLLSVTLSLSLYRFPLSRCLHLSISPS